MTGHQCSALLIKGLLILVEIIFWFYLGPYWQKNYSVKTKFTLIKKKYRQNISSVMFTHIIYGKKFVKVTVLLNELLKSWFDEIFFGETKFFIFPHCAICGNCGNLLSYDKNFVKSTFLIRVDLTKYFLVRPNFSFAMQCWNCGNLL